jgi:aminopeptidase N
LARTTWRDSGIVSVVLLGLTLAAAPARAQADPPRELPPDEVLRLMEEAAHHPESVGKSSLTAGRESPFVVAAESLHAYDAIHYDLDVVPSRTSFHVDGRMTLTLVVRAAGLTHVDLDALEMTFSSVKVNGVARTGWSWSAGKLLVPVCEGPSCPPHAPGDTLVVEVTYAANPSMGFYTYPRNTYTSVEPDLARRWWPCYDQPFDKATLDLRATVPSTESCWSNGVLVSVTPSGTPGLNVWHWRETHPIATYLVSIAVANYWRWDQSALGIPIVNVAFPEDSTKAKLDYVHLPQMMTVFSTGFGAYPFDKYGQATVEPYGPGGMEHQTMTTLRRSLLRGDRFYEYVWSHELAHQWWGDWVTCVDFRDIWLNEGFASFGEAYFVEQHYSPAAYDSAIAQAMNAALAEDQNLRYPLYNPPPGKMFGTTIYKKGESVLHMLRRIVGDAAFFDGLRLYGTRFAYGNATTRDFQEAIEDAWGQPLDWFFDPWVFEAGIPTYAWTWQVASPDPPQAGHVDLGLHVRQVQTSAPFYRMPIEFRVTRAALPDTVVTVWNEAVEEQAFAVRIRGTVTGVVFDPRASILKRIQPGVLDAGAPIATTAPGGGHVALRVSPNPASGAVALRGTWHPGTTAGAGPGPEVARFAVYDATGRLVRDLGDVGRPAGAPFVVSWDRTDQAGRRVVPGLYFVRITAAGKYEARPVVLVP